MNTATVVGFDGDNRTVTLRMEGMPSVKIGDKWDVTMKPDNLDYRFAGELGHVRLVIPEYDEYGKRIEFDHELTDNQARRLLEELKVILNPPIASQPQTKPFICNLCGNPYAHLMSDNSGMLCPACGFNDWLKLSAGRCCKHFKAYLVQSASGNESFLKCPSCGLELA